RLTQPDSANATSDPMAGDACSRPSVEALPAYTLRASAGNNARGWASTIAHMSRMNVIARFGADARNRSPSTIERSPGTLAAAFCGRTDGSRSRAYNAAVNVTASIAYVTSTPCQAMSTPAVIGPTVNPRLNDAIDSAFAAGSS